MSKNERVQRWRQRQRAAGKKPLTIWVTDEEKLRLKHLLAQWQGESFPVTDTVTDTILQGVTDTVTAMRTSPLSHAGNIDVTATVTDTQSIVTFTVTDTEEAIEAAGVTDTVTDTSPVPGADYGRETAPERVTDTVTDTYGYSVPEAVIDHQGEYVTDTVTDTSDQIEAERVAIRALQGVTDTVTDTESVTDTVTVTDPSLAPFDATKFYLGTLCPRRHDYYGTGQSLRRQHNQRCRECESDSQREARARKKVAREAVTS